jgi:hypothetical protein
MNTDIPERPEIPRTPETRSNAPSSPESMRTDVSGIYGGRATAAVVPTLSPARQAGGRRQRAGAVRGVVRAQTGGSSAGVLVLRAVTTIVLLRRKYLAHAFVELCK